MKVSTINMLQSLLLYRNLRKGKQEPPIEFAEKLLSLFDTLNILTRECQQELMKTEEEIKLMEKKLESLQGVSDRNEESIYQSQILIAEGESLLIGNQEEENVKNEETSIKLESVFSQIHDYFGAEYKTLQPKLQKDIPGKEREDTLQNTALLTKIKEAGKLLKCTKTSTHSYNP